MPSRRQFLAGAGAAGLAAVAGCVGGPEARYAGSEPPDTRWWPQPSFDRIASAYNPKPVGPRSGVRERWSLEISGPSTRPVVTDGVAYLPTAAALVAVDAGSGEELWREDGGDPPLWPRSVVHHDGAVFVSQVGEPGLAALDAATGETRWTFDPPGDVFGVYALLVDPDRPVLFAGGNDETLYALDPATGEVRWSRGLFGSVTHLAQGIPGVLAATDAGEVYALRSGDGDALWRRKLPGHPRALATANGEGAFVSLFGGPTLELDDTRAGATGWSADVWSADGFVVAGTSLVAAGSDLVSLDRREGDRQWTGGGTTQCGPAAAGDTVYAAGEGAVAAYAFDGGVGVGGVRFGAKRWSHPVAGRPEQGLAVADGAVFVLTEGGGRDGPPSMAYALEEA